MIILQTILPFAVTFLMISFCVLMSVAAWALSLIIINIVRGRT